MVMFMLLVFAYLSNILEELEHVSSCFVILVARYVF